MTTKNDWAGTHSKSYSSTTALP